MCQPSNAAAPSYPTYPVHNYTFSFTLFQSSGRQSVSPSFSFPTRFIPARQVKREKRIVTTYILSMATGRVVKWPKIFLYGDSLTQFSFSAEGCWGALVADHFQRRADVVVRGFSGYNSRQCRALLPYVASDLNGVVAATIFLGANDASEDNSQQAIPLKEYAQNLKDIVAHFQQLDVSPIVITPPVLDGESWQRYCGETGKPYSKEEELTTKYAHTCANTAASLKVPCIDLHTAMINQDDWKGLLCDGLHFSRRGSELLASLLIPTMEQLVVGRVPSHPLLPPWDTIHHDPATTFTQWCTQHSP